MTKVGVLSDTHISAARRRVLPGALLKAFEDVDLILHGGDVTAQSVLDELQKLAPVLAVHGNNDAESLGLPVSRRVEIEQVVIGMCHGDVGASASLKPVPNLRGNGITAACALSLFQFETDVRCIIFGHSHNPVISSVNIGGRPMTLFNPGSPTDKRWNTFYGFGLMRIDGTHLETELKTWE